MASSLLDRIIQECVRIIIEPICEARFYPQSYGFRPYRAQKHAIRGIINVINAGCKSPDQPVWAIEGDIKGCFDNINHRLLLQKLWRIGIHDKRVLKIISQMLKAGYMENDLFHATELGTPQGGILSPLLSNVYLNDFDWYAYSRDKGKCKCCGNAFSPMLQKHCHHVKNKLPLDRINKVPNLVWLCEPCHRMVHNSPIPPELDAKTVGKIMKYREKLKL